MPFTFSHPALVIPLLHVQRRYPWLSATGLITGSIAPDFEKFFKLQLASGYSHTVPSIFYFSCPVAVGLSFVFHRLVRRPLLDHLPPVLHQRLAKRTLLDWPRHFRRHAGGVLLSIVLGAALHLLWDGFTHPNFLIMSVLPEMAQTVRVADRPVPLYQVSGLVNSVLGGLAIGWAVWGMPVRLAGPPPAAAPWWHYWGMAAGVAGVLVALWVLVVQPRLLDIGITAISAAMVGIVASSVYATYAGRQRPAPGRPR